MRPPREEPNPAKAAWHNQAKMSAWMSIERKPKGISPRYGTRPIRHVAFEQDQVPDEAKGEGRDQVGEDAEHEKQHLRFLSGIQKFGEKIERTAPSLGTAFDRAGQRQAGMADVELSARRVVGEPQAPPGGSPSPTTVRPYEHECAVTASPGACNYVLELLRHR
jgi:hypothetical protein